MGEKVSKTPEEVIAEFEGRSTVPGRNAYEMIVDRSGAVVAVAKIKPDGEEVIQPLVSEKTE